MNWSTFHSMSEHYASLAEMAMRQDDQERAAELYLQAAEQEMLALKELDPSKKRTLGITTVSTVSLFYKAQDFWKAQHVAHQELASGLLPSFAVEQLQGLLLHMWNKEVREKAGISFIKGEVLVSVKGGEIVTGGAPLDLIKTKVDQVSRYFYRIIEMLLDKPFREGRSSPNREIRDMFRPWLFHAPPGSYQFAVRVQKPKQISLFPEVSPEVEQITEKFLDIIRACVNDPEGKLEDIVPDKDYRNMFLKLTKSLSPTGKTFDQLEFSTPANTNISPVVILPRSRKIVQKALRKLKVKEKEKEGKKIQVSGLLRGLQLDKDWIDINVSAEETIHIYGAGEVIDDVIGPMVNRLVIVDVIEKPSKRLEFLDIELDE